MLRTLGLAAPLPARHHSLPSHPTPPLVLDASVSPACLAGAGGFRAELACFVL